MKRKRVIIAEIVERDDPFEPWCSGRFEGGTERWDEIDGLGFRAARAWAHSVAEAAGGSRSIGWSSYESGDYQLFATASASSPSVLRGQLQKIAAAGDMHVRIEVRPAGDAD